MQLTVRAVRGNIVLFDIKIVGIQHRTSYAKWLDYHIMSVGAIVQYRNQKLDLIHKILAKESIHLPRFAATSYTPLCIEVFIIFYKYTARNQQQKSIHTYSRSFLLAQRM